MQRNQQISVHIDGLTNSIIRTGNNESFPTIVLPVDKKDLKDITKKAGWLFNWKVEGKEADRLLYKLVIEGQTTIQGLISLTDKGDHVFMHLVESAPHNIGKRKTFQGVPANLVAFACLKSQELGYDGVISFISKTVLIQHYIETLGATPMGGQRMAIYPLAAMKLIQQYFKQS